MQACSGCCGVVPIIASIEMAEVIEKILAHVDSKSRRA
jgi:hypothetical protein